MRKFTQLTTLVLVLAFTLTSAPAFAADNANVVNINDANASQLAKLPRVGPALAGRILEFREENGKFEATEDLMLVRGIGEKTFLLMESFVTVEGKTTLTEKVSSSEALDRLESNDDAR
jgi:competence ComEA-like helix-hairpin-helix protein